MTNPAALAAAEKAVRDTFGAGHAGTVRGVAEIASRAYLADLERQNAASTGWTGIRDRPDGMITTDGPQAASALVSLKGRAGQLEQLARDILATFKSGKDGHYRAHIGPGQHAQWTEQAGGSR